MVGMQLVAVDTNSFIYYFQRHPEYGSFAKLLFEYILVSDLKAVTSILTLIELLSLRASRKDIDKLRNLFLEIPNLKGIEVNEWITLDAARIRRKYGFRLPEAIQVATALYAKAEIFVTNDKRLSNFNELQIKMLSEIESVHR